MRPTRTIHDMLASPRGIAGGTDDEAHFENIPEEFAEGVGKLADLTDEELGELKTKLHDAVHDDEGGYDMDQMQAMADAFAAAKTEEDKRELAAEEAAQKLADIRAGVTDEPAAEETPPEEEPKEEEATEEPPKEEGAEEPKAEEEKVEEPVAASARPVRVSDIAKRRPKNRAPKPDETEAEVAIVAAGDVRGFSASQNLTFDDLGRAFAEKAAGVGKGRDGDRYPVATLRLNFPEERTLVASSAQDNMEKIEALASPQALVAAGGICPVLNLDYTFETLGDGRRPIRDALVRVNADRGGVRMFDPIDSEDVAGASTIWTRQEDIDAATDANVRKPCVRLDCPTETTVYVHAVPLCLTIGNFNRKFFPELFQAWWPQAQIEHAKTAEAQVYADLVTLSTEVNAGTDETTQLGAGREFVAFIERAGAALRDRHRISPTAPLRLIIPEWTVPLLSVDFLRQLPGDNTYQMGVGEITALFSQRNINVTFSPDVQNFGGAQGVGTLIGWPDTVDALLYPEGTFIFLDGGELDFGVEIRDSTLNRANDSQAFMETFEGVAKRGAGQSLSLTLDVCPHGGSSATRAFYPCASSGS